MGEETTRALVTIRLIRDVIPIEGADAIECVVVDGWQCVAKKGEFQIGDKCMYHEIDSILPEAESYAFLIAKQGRQYERGFGARLRTIKLRGQISQGLALPLLPTMNPNLFAVGEDITDLMGVYKYEAPVNQSLAGNSRGNYPSWLPKTDQERVENCFASLFTGDFEYQHTIPETGAVITKKRDRLLSTDAFVMEEKLEGSSMSIFKDRDGVIGVTSRTVNLSLDNVGNSFVDAAKASGILEALEGVDTEYGGIAIRGELIGPGLPNTGMNIYKRTTNAFYVFDVFSEALMDYLAYPARLEFLDSVEKFGRIKIDRVPFLGTWRAGELSVEDVVKSADGISELYNTKREGVVFKSLVPLTRHSKIVSFKAVSRSYLLSEK